AVDLRSSRSSDQRLDVASRTTDFAEQAGALLCKLAACELGITRSRLRGSNKPGEAVNVGKAIRSCGVIGLRSSVAKLGYLIGLKPVRDAHLIEVSVAGER